MEGLDKKLKYALFQLYEMVNENIYDKTSRLPHFWKDRIRIAYNTLYFTLEQPSSELFIHTGYYNFEKAFEGILGKDSNVKFKYMGLCPRFENYAHDKEYKGTSPVLSESVLKKLVEKTNVD